MSLFLNIVRQAAARNAGYIHLSAGAAPTMRIDDRIVNLDYPVMSREDMESIASDCLGRDKYAEFLKTGDADTAAIVDETMRVRANAFKQLNGISVVMRIIKSSIPSMASLSLPKSISKILDMREGLVIATGPTGSGKTTTIASIVNEFNLRRKFHIITIEDPIEYVHTSRESMINQREVGTHCASYGAALRAALREDPNIIMVGEMRDLESISIALTAAETGHLVLSTLHTIDSAKTIDRLIDVFPTAQQHQIRTQISMTLKAVVSQRLLPRADGLGRIGAFEVMYVNSAISNLIRENKTANISQVIQTGAAEGMITLDKSIGDLYASGKISKETAIEYSQEFSRKSML